MVAANPRVNQWKLLRTGRLTDFPWQPEHVSAQFRNVGAPWTPSLPDVLRWKLGLGPTDTDENPGALTLAPIVVAPNRELIEHPNPERINVTWVGHSTFLVQVAGFNILTDPIFSEYCAPWPISRLRRTVPPGLAISQLPPIDLVLISHSHYDHLDRSSLLQLGCGIPIACPLGLTSHLQRWGFANAVEFGWGDEGEFGGVHITCLPGQHGSARTPFDRDATLWCGWLLNIGGRKIYFAGDTGYALYFADLFPRFAPVDLALLPIGAYAPRWFMQPLHLNPEEAVQVHSDLRAHVSIAMHWGTFRLSDEPLGAPMSRLRTVLARSSISEFAFRIAAIGETITLSEGDAESQTTTATSVENAGPSM